MTLTDAQNAVRLMIMETAAEVGLVTDAQIASFVNIANRNTWNEAVAIDSDPWIERGTDQVLTVALGFISIQALHPTASLAPDVVEIDYLEAKDPNGRYYAIWPVEGSHRDRFLNEPSFAGQYSPTYGFDFKWYLEGTALRLTPQPSKDVTIRGVSVVKPTDLTNGTDILLGGRFPMHHDLVATRAAILCLCRDGVKSTPWDKIEASQREAFFVAMNKGLQAQRSRRVVPRDPFNS